MPKFKAGDMWMAYSAADLFLITANATITVRGALVMGRGIVHQAKEWVPGLNVALGRQKQTLCGNQDVYGLLVSPRWPAAKLGAFQVKRHCSVNLHIYGCKLTPAACPKYRLIMP